VNRRWLVSRTNPEFLRFLSKKASISTTLAQILVNRGIKDIESIKEFLNPSLERLHAPFLMPDMKKAVERLRMAIEKDETVFICGDYDADGITSTALLVSVLSRLGLKTLYHIPHRILEGYGLSDKGIQEAKACGATLIITADCGISSEKEVLTAISLGIDVIITDHHEPPEKLPPATAIIDPHRVDSEYPFKYLAGVGVVYKLLQALIHDMRYSGHDIQLENLLDLVAIGTIADSVPLIGENRILVTYGLERLNNNSQRPGIEALKEVAGVNREFRSDLLSYTLIPRINAAGRLDDANEVVELLLTENESRAKEVAAFLEEQNRKRQRIEEEVFNSTLEMITPDQVRNAIVLSSPEWHPGVIGIVASRLVEMFYRPVFLFSIDGSIAKGSARSIPPLHLYRAIAECSRRSGVLLGFGGHRQAAGLRLLSSDLPLFEEEMNSVVEETLNREDLIPILKLDAGVKLSEINFSLVRELKLLEPYGDSNEEPLLGIKGVEIIELRIVGNNHLKMRLKQDSISIDTIGFSMGDLVEKIETSCLVDIAFVPCINEWNGNRILQLNLRAIRPSQ
jgi:single-stranded-DNA-specific exonuclease